MAASKERKLPIEVPGAGRVSALHVEPQKPGRWTLVHAPGAGANLRDPFGAFLARALPERGIGVVRFQFPYMEAGKSGPDRPPVLEATWRAVIEAVRQPRRKLCVGGRSMGGRIASMVAAEGAAVDAVALFAYPLHPPGKSENARVEHPPRPKVPTLFVSGTRDAFGSPEELRAAAKKVRGSKTHFMDGADHGYAVKKSTGRTKDDVFAEAVEVFADWLLKL
jgi:predicted alpha/beta-hydrolase family hydrolase